MGVLTCDRYNCENVMCDRYSCRYGYICDECFGELVGSGIKTNIEDFMQSAKHTYDTESATEYFDAEFPDQRKEEI